MKALLRSEGAGGQPALLPLRDALLPLVSIRHRGGLDNQGFQGQS
jgi:hypothetical protein